ncbi:MAG: hypothetical protein ABIH08_03770 [Candidatus Omnitrophota bacterium]
MKKATIKLKIADVVIQMQSRFPLKQFTKIEKELQIEERFDNFFYQGKKKTDILIDIEIVDKLPQVFKAKPLFVTYHFQDGSENWRLLKKGDSYIYKSPLEDKKQIMFVNKSFDKIEAFILPKKEKDMFGEEDRELFKKNKGFVWSTGDIIYDFLQVLLINYFAQRREGIFTHAIGIKDLNGQGLVFAGESGAGKSTTARIWHKHTKAMVLNDDRIIVRKDRKGFSIHGSPWHGDFNDYLTSRIDSAPLKKLFFIRHAKKNIVEKISKKEAFNKLYPALFPTFWDKQCLENIVSFCQDLISAVPCYSMGFVNDKKVIDFVRRV